jgi:hypothetical protein
MCNVKKMLTFMSWQLSPAGTGLPAVELAKMQHSVQGCKSIRTAIMSVEEGLHIKTSELVIARPHNTPLGVSKQLGVQNDPHDIGWLCVARCERKLQALRGYEGAVHSHEHSAMPDATLRISAHEMDHWPTCSTKSLGVKHRFIFINAPHLHTPQA